MLNPTHYKVLQVLQLLQVVQVLQVLKYYKCYNTTSSSAKSFNYIDFNCSQLKSLLKCSFFPGKIFFGAQVWRGYSYCWGGGPHTNQDATLLKIIESIDILLCPIPPSGRCNALAATRSDSGSEVSCGGELRSTPPCPSFFIAKFI